MRNCSSNLLLINILTIFSIVCRTLTVKSVGVLSYPCLLNLCIHCCYRGIPYPYLDNSYLCIKGVKCNIVSLRETFDTRWRSQGWQFSRGRQCALLPKYTLHFSPTCSFNK